MNTKTLRFVVFGLLAAAQLAIAGSSVMRHELILRTGKAFRFRTTPVDPVDFFRGRYVRLSFQDGLLPWHEGDEAYESHQQAWAMLENDDEGFARFVALQSERPAEEDYVGVEIINRNRDSVRFKLLYDRYYMNEEAAPAAETTVLSRLVPVWATMRIRKGVGVIESLELDERSELAPVPLLADELISLDDKPIPEELLAVINTQLRPDEKQSCRQLEKCIVFAAALDRLEGDEYVFASANGEMRVFGFEARENKSPGWKYIAYLRPAPMGGHYLAGSGLIEALRTEGVSVVEPEFRELRIGEYQFFADRLRLY